MIFFGVFFGINLSIRQITKEIRRGLLLVNCKNPPHLGNFVKLNKKFQETYHPRVTVFRYNAFLSYRGYLNLPRQSLLKVPQEQRCFRAHLVPCSSRTTLALMPCCHRTTQKNISKEKHPQVLSRRNGQSTGHTAARLPCTQANSQAKVLIFFFPGLRKTPFICLTNNMTRSKYITKQASSMTHGK